MPSTGRMAWRRRIQGLLFLVVVAGLVGLTIAVYNKSLPWQGSDTVYLTAARIGNELNVPSDVKYDGVLVGRVSSVSSNGENATLTLQINPSAMAEIPANVEAQILPKTLFGEKYVQLVQPAQPATQSIAVNATIPQDRSKTSLELQTVFDNLVPLLRALNPAQLSVTLTNLADTLQGRGQELGQNLALMNQYFKTFNTDLPNLNHDISALATLAGNYAQASPDLLATLRNFSQTAQTFVAKQASYATFLANSQGLTTTASRVIGGNADRLIRLNAISRPVTTEYGRDAIVFECMANGLAIYDRQRLEGTFGPASADPQGTYNTAPRGVPGLHITLIPVGDRGTYTSKPKREELTKLPNYGKAHGQRKSDLLCRGLPYGNHPLRPQFDRYPKYPGAPRGNYNLGGFAASSAPSPAASKQSTRKASGHAAASPASQVVPGTGGDGSSQEQLGISGMLASFGDPRSNSELGLEDLLLGPMLRDMTVVPSKDVRR